ncbi:MAG: hypothetical protein JWN43_2065 [Gammaproteobacteria bacterium]|nr:hypothetical protein [Gammaproteobacteria bacterium]
MQIHPSEDTLAIPVRVRTVIALALVAVLSSAQSRSVDSATAPCDTPQHHQFDFWVGDWQVFDAKTNQLVAFDHVEKHSHGCIVQQNLTMVTDLYRRQDVGYRMTGIGVNRFDGESWLELWADNQWGAIVLRGMPGAGKAMVLTTIIPSRNRDLRLEWEKRPDGSVRALQYVAPTGSGKWELYGDLIYRPNR